MRSSNIGGQAVLEGIMMKNGDRYAVAVRKPNQQIEVSVEEYKSVIPWNGVRKIPFIRGIFNFVDSLVLGMKTLIYSAEFMEDEEEKEELTEQQREKEEKKERLIMNLTMAFSVVLAIAVFMVFPYFLSNILRGFIKSRMILTVCEGILRVLIFLGYILLVSRMKDIQRTFMYHGAEHKCINCIEHGLELNVENVRASSRQHKRCGTSFLFFVMIVSITFFLFLSRKRSRSDSEGNVHQRNNHSLIDLNGISHNRLRGDYTVHSLKKSRNCVLKILTVSHTMIPPTV